MRGGILSASKPVVQFLIEHNYSTRVRINSKLEKKIVQEALIILSLNNLLASGQNVRAL